MILISGLLALSLTLLLWFYLRLRVRHLRAGAERLREFRLIASDLVGRSLPEKQERHLDLLARETGRGRMASALLKELLHGKLGRTPTREKVESGRSEWGDIHSETRIRYVQAFAAALLADSFYAGPFAGTLFRRAFFYLSTDTAEIARAVDAYETRILILGAAQAADRQEACEAPEQDNLVRA